MPTYEYKCDECGIVFERFQHFSEEPVKVCPECNGQVHRVIFPVGIIFKGSGFYITDHRSGKSSSLPSKVKEGEDGSSKVESSDSEAKASDVSPASGGSDADKY